MMWLTFSNPKKTSDNFTEKELSPYKTSPTWAMESFFIDIYSLLAHRIKGLGWSLDEFWKTDTWTTSKLYCMELEIIDEEERAYNGKKDPTRENNEQVEDLYEEMFKDDS